MANDELESIRAFARRAGRTHPTIIQAIKEGRITAVSRDAVTDRVIGIFWRMAMVEYARNTDPTQAERTGAAPLNVAGATENPGNGMTAAPSEAARRSGQDGRGSTAGQIDGAPGDDLFDRPADTGKPGKEDPHGYLEHRARTEEFRAKTGELAYLKDLGLLVSAQEVREAQFRRDRTLRDKLLNIPDRIATIVAAERDPTRVHQQMTDEIKRVLSELSNDAYAEAAGGPSERVAA